MAYNFYGAVSLTGGATGSLDSIDGTSLISGDGAYVITSTGFYIYYLSAASGAAESSPDVVSPDTNAGNKRWILQGSAKLIILDTDGSNELQLKWNENDSSDRTLNFKVNSGDRTLDLSENFTLANGQNLTITVEDADSAVVLDNVNFEVENTNGTQRTIKITSAKAGNTTLTLEENLTIGDGYDITITAEDAATAIVLDNANLEIENTNATQRDIKITSAKAGNTTLTLEENLTVGDGYDVTVTAEDAAGAITLDNVNLEVEDAVGSGNTIKIANATSDESRTVTLAEDLTILDGQNVVLHASGGEAAQLAIDTQNAERTIDLSANLTVASGSDVTITAEDAAGAIVLDNINFEVEDTVGSGNTIKIANATDDASRTITLSEDLRILNGSPAQIAFSSSATLTVEANSTVDQDLTQDNTPTFASTDLTNVTDTNIPMMAAGAAGFADSPLTTDGTDVTSAGKVVATAFISGTTTVTATGPTDNLDVGSVNIVLIDASSNDVTIGGFINGVNGQRISVVRLDAINNVTLEHAEGTGNQDIYLSDAADEVIAAAYGGWVLTCNGTHWYEESTGGSSSDGVTSETDTYQDLLGGSAYLNCSWDGFTNEDLTDAGNTTMDFSLSEDRYDMTIGEIVQSDDLYDPLLSVTVVDCMVSVDYVDSGTPTIQATANGTNWETVTNNTLHTFTNTGTTLKLRFTAGGTGYVKSWAVLYNPDTGTAYGSSVRKYITFSYEGLCQDEDTIVDGFFFNNSVTVDKITIMSRVAPTGANLTIDLLKDGAEQSKVATLTAASTGESTAITSEYYSTAERFGLKIKSIGSTEPGQSLQVIVHYYDRS